MGHVDLWEEILLILEAEGHEVHWLHLPFHIGIRGNDRADQLAAVGGVQIPRFIWLRLHEPGGQGGGGGRRGEGEQDILHGEPEVTGEDEEPPAQCLPLNTHARTHTHLCARHHRRRGCY